MSRLSRITILLGLLLLNACGYSLRSSDALSASLQNLQLNLQNPNSEFSRLLGRSLDGISTATEGVDTIATVLSVSDTRLENRPVSVNPAARAAQYELRLSVDIQLSRGEEDLIPLETLNVERSYFEDIENISGNREEVEIITNEMRRELVNLLIRRLQATTS